MQWRKHKASTRAAVEGHMRNHILPTFGPMRLGAIRPSHVEDWVSVKAMELSPSTLHVAFAWLRSGEVLGLRRHRLDLLGTHFHDLRHTYASLLIEAGMNVKIVSARLGHGYGGRNPGDLHIPLARRRGRHCRRARRRISAACVLRVSRCGSSSA